MCIEQSFQESHRSDRRDMFTAKLFRSCRSWTTLLNYITINISPLMGLRQ